MTHPLFYSLTELHKLNQCRFIPFGKLGNVEVDLANRETFVDFEVIDIMDKPNPCLSLLGLQWAFENPVVIDLNKETITFEVDGMKVTCPLDPYQGIKLLHTK